MTTPIKTLSYPTSTSGVGSTPNPYAPATYNYNQYLKPTTYPTTVGGTYYPSQPATTTSGNAINTYSGTTSPGTGTTAGTGGYSLPVLTAGSVSMPGGFNYGSGTDLFGQAQRLGDNVEQQTTATGQTPTNVLNVLNPLANSLGSYTNQASSIYQQGQNLNLPSNLSLRTNFQTTPLNLDTSVNKYALNNYDSTYNPTQVSLQNGYNPTGVNLNTQFNPYAVNLSQNYNPSSVNLNTQFNPYSVNLNQNYSPEMMSLLQSLDPSQVNLLQQYNPEMLQLGGNFAGQTALNNAMSGGIDNFGQRLLSQGYQDINARQTATDNQLASTVGRSAGNESLLNVLRGQGAMQSGLQANALYGEAASGTLDRAMAGANLQNQYQGLVNDAKTTQNQVNNSNLLNSLNFANQSQLAQAGYNFDTNLQSSQFANTARQTQTGYNNQELLNRLNFSNQNQLAQTGFNQDSAFQAGQLSNDYQLQQTGFNNSSILDALNFGNQNQLAQAGFNQDSAFQAGQLSNDYQLQQTGFNNANLLDALNFYNQNTLAQAGFNQDSAIQAQQLSNQDSLAQTNFLQNQENLTTQLQNAAMLEQAGFTQQANFLRDQLYNTAMLQQYGFNQQASLADLQAQLAALQPSQNLLEALTNLQGQQRGVTSLESAIGQKNFT